MDARIEAKILIEHFIPVVYPYSGSGYLTGTEDKYVKFNSAKKEALYVAGYAKPINSKYYEEVINAINSFIIDEFDIE